MKRFNCAVAILLTYVLCASALLQPVSVYAASAAGEGAGSVATEQSNSSEEADESADQPEGQGGEEQEASVQEDQNESQIADSDDVSGDAETTDQDSSASEESEADDSAASYKANSWRYIDGELRNDIRDDNASEANFYGRAMHRMPDGATAQGIDVSGLQGDIDWQKVKDAGIDYAIIKIGSRDNNGWWTDSRFLRNVTECERLGIPWGAYVYSYARNATEAAEEADFAIGKLSGHHPTLPIYFDLEETPKEGEPIKWLPYTDSAAMASIAKAFCNKVSAAGYKPGIYASAGWFKNYLTDPCFTNSGWNIWTAQYWYGQRYDASLGLGPEYPAKFDCWQYSAHCSVPGVNGDVDVNYWFEKGLSDHWEETDEGKYYVSSTGQPYKGWKLISGLWYWLDPAKGGAMATGPAEVEGTWYVFSSSGALSSGWVRKDGEWYYGASGGKMVRGWVKGSAWYYTDPESGRMLTGAVEIDGKSYWLDPANGGACARSAWVEMPEGFLSYAANDGVLCMAVKDGVLYKDATFAEVLSGWVDCGDDRLYADSQGHVLTGWQRIDDNWYLFDSNGIMHRGWYWNGSAYFYLDKSNGIMRTGWVSDLGSWYWLDPDNGGAMATGWKKVGQSWYYLNPNNGGRMVTGSLMIDGYIRTFNSDGSCIYWGYQNPSNYYQVSSKSVTIPHLGQGIFGYRTESRISVSATRDECVNAMITRAYDYVGTTPYIWDYSCAPGVGVDCAGLVMQCLYATGMDLGRYTPWDHYYTPGHDHYANDMWNDPKFKHLDFSQRRRGDLICYNGHIAIYLGNDQIIEAASPRYGVRVHSVYVGYPIKGVLRPFV